jgi:hypothetical protein
VGTGPAQQAHTSAHPSANTPMQSATAGCTRNAVCNTRKRACTCAWPCSAMRRRTKCDRRACGRRNATAKLARGWAAAAEALDPQCTVLPFHMSTEPAGAGSGRAPPRLMRHRNCARESAKRRGAQQRNAMRSNTCPARRKTQAERERKNNTPGTRAWGGGGGARGGEARQAHPLTPTPTHTHTHAPTHPHTPHPHTCLVVPRAGQRRLQV